MEPQTPNRNISKVRTFSSDVVRAQTTAVTKPQQQDTKIDAPAEVPEVFKPREPLVQPIVKKALPVSKKKEVRIQPKKKPARILSLNMFTAPVKKVPLPPVTPAPQKESPVLNKKYEGLRDEVDAVSGHVEKTSILSDDASVYDTGLGGGTIIRDTKRKRFRLLPATIDAIRSWFTVQQDAYEKKHEQYTVAKAESRTETIKEATRSSNTAPTEDFATVVKRLKQIPRAEIESTLTFKKKAELAPPGWTHIQEDPVVPQQSVAPEGEAVISTEGVTPTPLNASQETPEVTPQPLSPDVSQETVTPPPTVQTQQEEPEVVEPLLESGFSQIEDQQGEVSEPSVAEPLEVPPPKTLVPPPVKEGVPQYQTTASRNVPRFPYALLIGVVLITTALGMGTSYYFFVIQNPQSTVAQPSQTLVEVPSLITVDTQEVITLSSREALLEDLSTATQARTQVVQFYPTIEEATGKAPASARAIVSVLEPHTQESFNRNIEEMTFGASGTGQPFIVLEITNFDIAFSGMLTWEQTLSADLYPLFGDIVRETYDPTSRTNTQLTAAYFKDAIANNTIVRVLLDENGEDRITYTFVDRDTILITTTRGTLQELLPRVQ